jgi:hypothetical protein
MADIHKFEKRSKALGEKLPPALRAFVEEVIVPALVREYVAEQKNLASGNCGVAKSPASVSFCEVPR